LIIKQIIETVGKWPTYAEQTSVPFKKIEAISSSLISI